MKKWIHTIITVFVICIFGVFVIQRQFQKPSEIKQIQEEVAIPTVTLSIFDGVKTVSYTNIQALTPYEALTKVADQGNIQLKTKQYDFGVFVEGIAENEGTKDKVWIYFVNGISGEVAADKYELKQNDSIEWKFTTPIY